MINKQTNGYIFKGQSMMPTLRNGDFLICHPPVLDRIRRGDIIVFTQPDDDDYIAHRVVLKTQDGFLTQGDHIPQRDPGRVTQDRICGVCIALRRGNRTIRLKGGTLGVLYTRFLPWRQGVIGLTRSMIRPIYHHFCRSWFWRGLTTTLTKPQVVTFQRPDGEEWKLLWRDREIGSLPPGKSTWQIKKPYLLIVNEAALPHREAP